MPAYYNEFEPYAAEWLRNLIAAGHLPAGDVDTRSIVEVQPDDLKGYDECHFFAGIGGWPLALRMAGWTGRPVWTGSCPCQPFSAAGKQRGTDDERHLWPEFFRLIAECRPATIFGEQVASKLGRQWLAGVFADLESVGYAAAGADLCAASVGAPHIRQRLWWVADAGGERRQQKRRGAPGDEGANGRGPGRHYVAAGNGEGGGLADAGNAGPSCAGRRDESGGVSGELGDSDTEVSAACWLADSAADGRQQECQDGPRRDERGEAEGRAAGLGLRSAPDSRLADANDEGPQGRGVLPERADERSPWASSLDCWLPCADGKARRIEPGIAPLAHGVSGRVGKLRAYGNAIVPQVAAAFVRAVR